MPSSRTGAAGGHLAPIAAAAAPQLSGGSAAMQALRAQIARIAASGAPVAIRGESGSGYPQGLVGENIHKYARIAAVADVFDALMHQRCYKDAWCAATSASARRKWRCARLLLP